MVVDRSTLAAAKVQPTLLKDAPTTATLGLGRPFGVVLGRCVVFLRLGGSLIAGAGAVEAGGAATCRTSG